MSIARQLPEYFVMESTVIGRHCELRIRTTIRTTREAAAVIEAIRTMRGTLTSHRPAVAADFGIDDRKPTYREQLEQAFGSVRTPPLPASGGGR